MRRGRVAVFCGGRAATDDSFRQVAYDFGLALADSGAGLVYGAGGGVMAAVADGVRAGGADAIGVIPGHLYEREGKRDLPGEIFIVRSMHERKALMYRLSIGFAVLPGGFGTIDEMMEVATWSQLGLHAKPLVVLNHIGYFDAILAFLDRAVSEGFLSGEDRRIVQSVKSIDEALGRLFTMAECSATPMDGARSVDEQGAVVPSSFGRRVDLPRRGATRAS